MPATFDPDSYATAVKRARVAALLDLAWPGMAERIPLMETWGAPWHVMSTPFVMWDGDHPIAHVGVLEMDLVVAGERRHVAGVHAVCTHPDHRRKGHSRALMERALAYCDARFETIVLFGDGPLYERYGFRIVDHVGFRAAVEPPPGRPGFRPLAVPGDLGRLYRALAHRAPVSRVLGAEASGGLFVCNVLLSRAGFDLVRYAEDLDLFAAYAVRDGELHLLDVVGERLPPLEDVLARIGEPFRTVRLGWTPDLLGGARFETAPLHDDTLMVRGPFAAEGRTFRFPALTQC